MYIHLFDRLHNKFGKSYSMFETGHWRVAIWRWKVRWGKSEVRKILIQVNANSINQTMKSGIKSRGLCFELIYIHSVHEKFELKDLK